MIQYPAQKDNSQQLKPFSEPKNSSENNQTTNRSDSKNKSSETNSPNIKYGGNQPTQQAFVFKSKIFRSPDHTVQESPEKSTASGTKIICRETVLEMDSTPPADHEDANNPHLQHQEISSGARSPGKKKPTMSKFGHQVPDPRTHFKAEESPFQIKKKKKLAKDDTMQDSHKWKSLKSSFEGMRNNYFEQNENDKSPSSSTRQNIFLIDRSFKPGQTTSKKPKRKMSATQLNFQAQISKPDLVEESDNEFDLTQSLLTLQLKNPSRPIMNKQQSQIFNQWDKSKKVENNLRGIPRESNHRKNSNYPHGSNIDNDSLSSNDSQVKDLKSQDGSELESVQLDDPQLENIGKIRIVSNGSSKGVNLNLQKAIEQAEIAHEIKSDAPEILEKETVQPEEYESLVWGQSIWSTDVRKESRNEFIKNLQSIASTQEIEKEKENDEVDDFDDIQKKIVEQTSYKEMKPQHMLQNYEFKPYAEQSPQAYQISQRQYPEGQLEYYNIHQQNFPGQPPSEFKNNDMQQQHSNYQNIEHSSKYNCGNSVHSGRHLNFPDHRQMSVYSVAPDYKADAASSNFTHHPYSQYNQQPSQQEHENFLGNQGQQQNGNNAVFNNQNRAHIFINRQINKYMMNPIYKSKQTVTSLQMHRYTGIPWRGGTMNAYHQMPIQQTPVANDPPRNESPPENFHQQTEIVDRYMLENIIENSPKGYDTQFIEDNNMYQQQKQQPQPVDTLNAQPFYPKNYGEQQKMKQQTINDSANILAAGKIPLVRQKAAPTIHVPIPIPIMTAQKNPFKQDNLKTENPKNQDSSIFMNNFFQHDIIMKKNELDKRMKETTQNLESKLIKAVQINDEDDNDDEEEEDLTFEVLSAHEPSDTNLSVERQESILNKSINIKELKHHLGGTQQINFRNLNTRVRRNSDKQEIQEIKENKIKQYEDKIKRKNDRAAIFTKLQSQLSEFKTEMFNNSEQKDIQLNNLASSSVSPKRSSQNLIGSTSSHSKLTPFKQDAKQYMDKVLNLMNIINEVDDLTNVAELKNKLEKQKLQLLKARAERDEVVNQLQNLQQTHRATEYQFREKEKNYQQQHQQLQNENSGIIQTLQTTLIQTREQHDQQIFSLTQQLDQLRQESQNLMVQNTQLQESYKIQESTMINQHNQMGQLNNKIESLNHNNYQLNSTLNQLQQENQKLIQEKENMEKEWVRKTEIRRQKNGSTDFSNGEEDDEDEVPLHEQLQNANQQVKDLQEYIKKRGFEDLKNNQIRQEVIQKNELAHQEKYNLLKKQKDEMEREKDKIIQRLKDFIINHNEPMLIGSCGSSMFSQYEEKKDEQLQIHDQSTIEAKSMDSFDNKDNDDYIRLIMNDYTCERCEEKDKIIVNNEQRIADYIAYIKKQSIKSSFREVPKSCVTTQTDTEISMNTSNSSSFDKSGTSLRSCHKILLSNYIRQFRVYLDNLDEEQSEKTSKMQQKLSVMAQKQKITLFHEEEDPDTSLVTKGLIQEIMSMSLDMITDLLVFSSEEASLPPVFKTVEFGLNFEQLKEMQNVARTERKSCHQIIVEIERLMYDMNNLMGKIPDKNAVQIFGQILDTYLQLPHRLKPIFDHCKKIEGLVLKALKSQDQILKSNDQNKV